MAETKGIQFTPETLSKTLVKYRPEMIQQIMLSMGPALNHMSALTGIRYKEVVASMAGKFEFSNYKKNRKGNGLVSVDGREIETFFGNCIEPIDPNSIYQSIWGSNVTKGDALKKVPIVKLICAYIMAQLGENIFLNLFTAKHVADADGTANWFNGFKTILDADETDGRLSTNDKNLADITAITAENAEDVIKDFYWGADKVLRGQRLKLFMSDMAYHYYTESYQMNHGALPYNQAYDKKTLEGAPNVEFVPLACVPDDFLLLTTRNNIKLLYNQKTDDETYIVEKSLDNHYDVDFIANMFFGTQFLSVHQRTLRYGRVKPTSSGDSSDTGAGTTTKE